MFLEFVFEFGFGFGGVGMGGLLLVCSVCVLTTNTTFAHFAIADISIIYLSGTGMGGAALLC